MDVAELPMILFTVLAQMCVGAFLVLGIGQFVGLARYGQATVDRVTDPALYAIGPALVLGLVASMFHMHDFLNVFNVFRHLGSSWLSREVTFGILFAAFGFLFAAMQWFKWGTPLLRRIVAAVTALLGVGLLVSMIMIYYTLRAVPAWSTWATPLQFVATSLLLGSLLVGMTFMASTMFRSQRIEQGRAKPADDDEKVAALTRTSLRWTTLTALVAAGAILVGLPLHIAQLAGQGSVGVASAAAFSGPMFGVRLALLVVGACILGVFVYVLASGPKWKPRVLAVVASLAFLLVIVGEFLGRAQFYESMTRVGM